MTLDIGEALRDGVDRLTTTNGFVLLGAFVLLGVLSAVITQTVTAESVARLVEFARQQGEPIDPSRFGPTPLALGLPLTVSLVLAFLVALLAEVVHIVAIRTFVSEERSTVPLDFLQRRIAWVTFNGFFGGIVVGVLVILGLFLLIVPGVFLYVGFFFVRQEIAVEDKNFVDAMADSWQLTKGNRVEVFVLGLVLLFVELVAGIPSVALGSVDPTAAVLVGAVLSAVAGAFVVATAARAYVQLRESEEESRSDERGEASTGTEPDGESDDMYTQALGPDDLDPP